MNVKELRAVMAQALQAEGFEERRLAPRQPKAWTLPSDDIIRCFWPHAIRYSDGFRYTGVLGIEIPSLRNWLREHKPSDEAGLNRSCFVGYHILNEDVFQDFIVEHDRPAPADLWAGMLKDRLDKVPSTLDALVAAYRRNKEDLGWFAHPDQRPAWNVILKWCENPGLLHAPKMLPDGRTV
jgi:hypothetical protein